MDWMESVLGEAGPHGGGAVLGFESQFVEVRDRNRGIETGAAAGEHDRK